MSVRVSERSISEIQYLYSAKQLRDFVVVQCTKLPTKYRPYMLNQLVSFSYKLFANCVYADILRDGVAAEAEKKLLVLLEAKSFCYCIEDTALLVNNRLSQNPENFDRAAAMSKLERREAIFKMLEKLGTMLVRQHDLLDAQLAVTREFIKGMKQ